MDSGRTSYFFCSEFVTVSVHLGHVVRSNFTNKLHAGQRQRGPSLGSPTCPALKFKKIEDLMSSELDYLQRASVFKCFSSHVCFVEV